MISFPKEYTSRKGPLQGADCSACAFSVSILANTLLIWFDLFIAGIKWTIVCFLIQVPELQMFITHSFNFWSKYKKDIVRIN